MIKFTKWLKSLRPYKPYLRAQLDLGFIGFHTEIMSHSWEMDAYKYIELRWHLFKWNGHFNLYKPGEDFRKKRRV